MTVIDGSKVEVAGTFRNRNGVRLDPDNIFVQYRFDSSTIIEKQYGVGAEVVRDSQGVYTLDIDTTGQGGTTCYYKIYSTGTGQAANEGSFPIRKSRIASQ